MYFAELASVLPVQAASLPLAHAPAASWRIKLRPYSLIWITDRELRRRPTHDHSDKTDHHPNFLPALNTRPCDASQRGANRQNNCTRRADQADDALRPSRRSRAPTTPLAVAVGRKRRLRDADDVFGRPRSADSARLRATTIDRTARASSVEMLGRLSGRTRIRSHNGTASGSASRGKRRGVFGRRTWDYPLRRAY